MDTYPLVYVYRRHAPSYQELKIVDRGFPRWYKAVRSSGAVSSVSYFDCNDLSIFVAYSLARVACPGRFHKLA